MQIANANKKSWKEINPARDTPMIHSFRVNFRGIFRLHIRFCRCARHTDWKFYVYLENVGEFQEACDDNDMKLYDKSY